MPLTEGEWVEFAERFSGLHDAYFSRLLLTRPNPPPPWLSVSLSKTPYLWRPEQDCEIDLTFNDVTEFRLDFDTGRDHFGVQVQIGACFGHDRVLVSLGSALEPLEPEEVIRQADWFLVCRSIDLVVRDRPA